MKPERNGQAIRHELERVLSSSGFARNARMSHFLRFLVERHLEGRDDEIKESLIAVEVFGRRPDYDPKLDSIVRTEAARLRARLIEYYAGEGRQDPVVIDVPKGGYIPLFRQAEAARERQKTRFGQRRLTVALACFAVGLTNTGWWSLGDRNTPIRIAVLPLENLSPELSSDYFADGLTDEIIRNLSVIEGLAVRSRTSSFAFKARPRNVREAGKLLEADYLVEGSVLREGEQLRINAQLIRARDDLPLWSGRFDRTLTDVFAIQDEISRGIVNYLRLQLGRGRRRYETSIEAYDLYLRAQAVSFLGAFVSEQQLAPTSAQRYLQRIELFEQAIARDPSFAPAYAGVAVARARRSVQFPLDHPPDELVKMRAEAQKAVQLDPLLAEAHGALAMAHARDGLWELAENSFRRAIELDPNRSSTDYAYWVLAVLGRHAEALQLLRAAERTDPLSIEVQRTLAFVLISAGRYDEGADHCQNLPSPRGCLARVRSAQGRFAEAIQHLANHPDLSRNPETRGFLGYAYARSGRREEAEKMAAASQYANEQALIFAGLGDKDRTLEALDRMAVLGAQRIGLYLNYPELALLRGDPRLKTFRKKVGLPENLASSALSAGFVRSSRA
jgi:TolB-like protein